MQRPARPQPPSPEELRRARQESRTALSTHAATQERQRTSAENPNFVADFLAASRLSFIGSWKARYEEMLSHLPPPPPLPAAAEGGRTILHIDMDCFFASVAARGRPALRNVPLAVSWSDNERGAAEIASCNYLARAQGIRNGTWVSAAKQKCPDLIIMPYQFEDYASTAEHMYRCVFAATPHVMGVSVDECYADVTGCCDDSSVAAFVSSLRAAIAEATGGCHASVGIGSNRLLARLATRHAKPNGQHAITREQAAARLADEPVDSLPGVGHDKRQRLSALGVETCGQLLALPASTLHDKLGPKVAETLRASARGVDKRPWEPVALRKSVGAQASWGVRFNQISEAEHFARQLCGEVATRMGQFRVRGRTLTLTLWRAVQGAPAGLSKGSMGHGLCDKLSRSCALPSLTADGALLTREALQVLRQLAVPPGELRGMGVQVSRLDNQPGGSAQAGGGARLLGLLAAAPPASHFDPASLPGWYHTRPGVTKAVEAAAAQLPAAAKSTVQPGALEYLSRKRLREADAPVPAPVAAAAAAAAGEDTAVAAEEARGLGEGQVGMEEDADRSARLGRALDTLTHVLNECFVEAVLRAEEGLAPADVSADDGAAAGSGDCVFAALLPVLQTLAAELRRVGGEGPASRHAVGQLASWAKAMGIRCLQMDDGGNPPEWASGLDGWLEACQELVD